MTHAEATPRGSPLHYTILTLLAAACLLPMLIMALTSVKTEAQIFDTRWSWLFAPTLENYRAVIQDQHIERYMLNSLKVSLCATLITLTLGTMCAYAMARFRFLGRAPLSYSTLILRTLPPAVLAVPVFVIWSDWGIGDTLSGVVLVYVALNLPFTIWLLYGFIDQVPVELEEAAAIDGCGPFKVFYKIVLPLLRPGLAAAAIFTFRLAWNEFILGFILTNRITRTLPASISNYITDTGVEWGRIMAAGVLIALPPLIFTFVAAKQIITGLTAGSVKG
ncbi:carbohydrate ABC transporter permease [Verminephrobacter aporrectodeae]|uniref:Carbohydrate ABC transporter permease n=1 Tax=Verminephrobacter aporrectodeae subsp. tuberculatae TaxID=1110392 RepID=A0ABT3KVB2_9BURK|nr:carbohydrate ABC transporter permease [Verminephrobacter aporrectodeae]MCW5256561.1 carbohydrate ABC transporter permease [Verminephrobacter aporrectodeae subsp. tuberculatae]MCW5322275.1 carbohydrate ABC transporter permease [Verminephrobacter aporrectodeae subsp. tuberculatae]MCW8175589.1 carbohydrate ABC transporter permease [Verminephrobacter aporrectodeae subsp. tuberculatae]MCW8203178.1 carbohydrate ABC transporter permease [Verminephrobacter aporrectodeae subsp. tuberculatae]